LHSHMRLSNLTTCLVGLLGLLACHRGFWTLHYAHMILSATDCMRNGAAGYCIQGLRETFIVSQPYHEVRRTKALHNNDNLQAFQLIVLARYHWVCLNSSPARL